MSCSLNIPYKKDISNLYNLGLNEAIAHGGGLSGDKQSGTFFVPALGGVFEGNYKVTNDVIQIEILKKPFFIPCNAIEVFLKSHVG
jgi:hypothetical protein